MRRGKAPRKAREVLVFVRSGSLARDNVIESPGALSRAHRFAAKVTIQSAVQHRVHGLLVLVVEVLAERAQLPPMRSRDGRRQRLRTRGDSTIMTVLVLGGQRESVDSLVSRAVLQERLCPVVCKIGIRGSSWRRHANKSYRRVRAARIVTRIHIRRTSAGLP